MKSDLTATLPALASRLGTMKLGFERDILTWSLHGRLSRALKKLSPPVRLHPVKGLFEQMREVKDKEEIKAMRASARSMSRILERVIRGLRTGQTEKEISWKIESLARQSGAEDLAFPSIVASGPNSALPHAVPTNRKIRAKEPITLDVGLKLNGYCSDMTRTVFLGRPGPTFRRIYATVRAAQLAALERVRPGVKTTVPDKVARDIIKEAGFGEYFGHALGHGVGLATHEGPRLGPKKPVRLREGMVVTVEPGIYIPGKGGVRLEEMVVVASNGPDILTDAGHFYDFQ
jgi:Xaa-Pro aminopeptidase